MNFVVLYFVLLQATVTSFSGLTSIPVVRSDLVVRRALISDEQLSAALAIGQSTPGPVGLYVVVVGYFAGGAAGAAAGALALSTPALLAVPLLRLVQRGRTSTVSNAAVAIVVAACVLTLATTIGLTQSAVTSLPLAGIGLASLALVAGTRMAPLWVVVLAGAAGWIVG